MTNQELAVMGTAVPEKNQSDYEQQVSHAIAHPRDEKKVIEGALGELRISPDFAKKAYYSIPFKNADQQITNVEGPSVKAAMALARRWGNCTNAVRIASDQDDRIIVEGLFIDYETNVRTLRTISISKYRYDKYTKTTVPLRDDRLNMAIQSGMSKAVRNAILASLPVFLVDRYMAEAKSLAVKGTSKTAMPLSIQQGIKKLTDAFIAKGARKETLDSYLKQLDAIGSEADTYATLTGAWNALQDGHLDIKTAFGESEEEKTKGPIPNAVDLFKK